MSAKIYRKWYIKWSAGMWHMYKNYGWFTTIWKSGDWELDDDIACKLSDGPLDTKKKYSLTVTFEEMEM